LGRPRLAFARWFQETNALSPVLTRDVDFARFETGPERLLSVCSRWRWEVPGIWFNAELTGFCEAVGREVELVPLFSAMAVPSGKVARETYDRYLARLLQSLQDARPLSGVYLALHGAMGVEGLEDAEGDLLQAVRAVIGEIPLVVSFDMHGFLTPQRLGTADLFVIYRTYPHRDQREVGATAARLLQDLVHKRIRPRHTYRTLPMILGGSPSVDFMMPMRPLFQRLRAARDQRGVLSAGVLCCQPWHDAPALGWCAYVATDGDDALADALADELAEAMWAQRHHLPPVMGGPVEALERARHATLRRRLGTVCLSDCSDAVGAGAVGENTAVLQAVLEQGQDLCVYAPVRDAPAVQQLWDKPSGAKVELEVGGKLAPAWYSPLPISGTLVRRAETLLGGRSVVLELGKLKLVVTEDAPIAVGPGFWWEVGLSPWRADVCVVKSWVAFRFYFVVHNRLSLWARTRGVTDVDAMRDIRYDTPVHPFASLEDWRATDRRRRGM
jgi:microcystin degradation protein MlrC